MKVAVLIDTWSPVVGGGQINAWEISKRIAKKGVEIDIVTRNCGQDRLQKIKNLRIYKLGPKTTTFDSLSKILFIFKSYFFISKRDYNLVHAHAFLPGITARLLMVFKGISAIFTVHGTSINTGLNNYFSKWLEKFILTEVNYSAQITVSRDFLKIKNVNNKIYYVPNGVDVSVFDKIKVKKFGQPTLIFVGRLHPQKNLETLISAMNIVKSLIPDIKLLIVGEGELKAKLQKRVKDLKLEQNVKFLGHRMGKDLILLNKSSHLFILPSIYEGQPLTLLEAWASRLPVIVTKTGDCQYLVKNGQNGYLIENPYNVNKIAHSIIKALNSKNLGKLGQNGYNFVKQNISWGKSADQMFKIYKDVLV